jgi:hypothetical protein
MLVRWHRRGMGARRWAGRREKGRGRMRVVLAEWRRVCERQQGRWRATTCVEGGINGRGGSDELTPRWDMEWSYRPGVSGVVPGTVGGWLMAYVRTHAATYVERRRQWAAWRARIAGGSGTEQWERYCAEVSRGGRPVYGKNAERWHTRCAAGKHGWVSGRCRQRETRTEDDDDMVHRWQRVEEGGDGLTEASAEPGVGAQTRQATQRTTRDRWRQARDNGAQATAQRVKRRGAMNRAAAAAQHGRLRVSAGQDDDETTTRGKTVLGKRTRRTDACNSRGRKRRAGVDEGSETASRQGRRRARNRIVTARQLERLRGGLGEPFGDG